MKKLELDDPETKSADVVLDNLSALQSLFPDVFREGRAIREVEQRQPDLVGRQSRCSTYVESISIGK
ncbi:hypothetical protein [Rhizobium laguerreae]|uniref:hypothetical protein n=1 Tax=Rhizobium laguerreae TaxID=1076926 RepID=UPI0021B0EBDE|nr:hypothetical protein [Rhizobium laguerreae]